MKKHFSSQHAFVVFRSLTILLLFSGATFLALWGTGILTNLSAENKESRKKVDAKLLAEEANLRGGGGVQVIHPYFQDVSGLLRNAPKIWPPVSKRRERPHEAAENPKMQHEHRDGADPVIQNNFFRRFIQPNIPGPTLSFAGIPFPGVSCNCAPPDPNGQVGKSHYVQMVNEGFQVFNKAGASVLGPNSIESVWSGFAGACETGGFGDPVVMYDQLADRWIITEFASPTGSTPITDQCVAVSQTGDPTGAYYRYGYHLGSNFFDYPHLGVWPDAYYMSMNVFNSGGTAQLGVQPFAFDRAQMLIGGPATVVTTGFAPGGANEDYFLPANLDGIIPPPAGAPNPFVEVAFPGASPNYKIYRFHADFATPANSTFTLAATLPAAPFTELCPGVRTCVPEPNGATLDGIGDRVMFRNSFRVFPDGHNAAVNNLSVSAGGVSGVRWFELRNLLTGSPTVFQEGTYQPDTTWRWMGSAAMDNQGNMAVGFSAGSASVVPGLRYAGRLAGDPVNVLAQGENTLFAGAGSQSTGTNSRWGDYSDLTVDPVDDCTFWYTGEFYPAGSADFNWRTQIGNFAFTQCTPPAKGTAHFAVTFCDGGAGLTGASISVDGMPYGASGGGGIYDVALAPGNHTYSITKNTFSTATGNFNITNGNTTNVSACLVGVPVIGPSGTTITAEGCSPANNAVDPNETVTMNFTLVNNGGGSTTNLVATLQNTGGVTAASGPQNYGVIAPTASATRPFTFTAANSTCGAVITATLQLQDGATNLGTAVFTFNTGALGSPVTVTYSSGNINTPLPDTGTADVPIMVSDTGVVADINVKVRVNHTFDGDVQMTLISPMGTAIPLVLNRGSSGANFGTGATDCSGTHTVFDDSAATAISAGVAPFAGSFKPESPLSGVNGQNVNGTWTVHFADTAAVDSGTIYCVQLEITRQRYICCGFVGTPVIVSGGAQTITAESAFPPDNAPEPGETLTANFPLINNGDGNTTNLVATLQNSGGVTPITTSQTYGVVLAAGPTVSKPFTFMASGACGGTITATLHLQDGATDLGNVTYVMTLGTTSSSTQTFSNPALITINDNTTATPYPSNIAVSGVPVGFSKLTVTLNGLNHTFPGDVDVLLVSPTGRKFIVMSDVIGGTDWTGQTYTFDDAAAALLPSSGSPPPNGSFKPTNYGTGDLFAAPAPVAPYLTPATAGTDTLASAFVGQGDPNGTWSLYVVDDAGVDVGTISGGWSIAFTVTSPICAQPVVANSVKTHTGVGDFGIPMPIAGMPGIECRLGGGTNDYSLVLTLPYAGFSSSGAPQAQVTAGTATIGTAGVSNGGNVTFGGGGTTCTIPLTNVTNAQIINVRVNNLTDGTNTANMTFPMAILQGDTNGDGNVNSADVGQAKSQSGQAVTGSAFRTDVNTDGNKNSGDVGAVKSKSGTALP